MQCSILPGSEMRQFPYEIKYSVGVSGGRPHLVGALLLNNAPNGAMSDGLTVLPLSVDGDRGQR